jgi:hypothetical protein
MYGCDPFQSSAIRLPLPQQAPSLVWQYTVTPLPCNYSSAPPHSIRGSSQAAAYPPSPGCISNGQQATCSVTLACDGEQAIGMVGLQVSENQTAPIWTAYTGPGSGRCLHSDQSAIGVPDGAMNLPLMDIMGNIYTWDHNLVSKLLSNLSVAWTQVIVPTSSCPGVISQVAFTNQSTLGFFIAPLATVFTYFTTAEPIASIVLRANDTGTAIFPLPSEPSFTHIPPSDGLLIPIAPIAVHGSRMLIVSRFYKYSGVNNSVLTPFPHVYIAAVDQRHASLNRIWWSWQLLMPLEDAFNACIPVANGNVSDETLTVSGITITPNATAVIAFSCRGTTAIVGFSVDRPHSNVPSILWTKHEELDDPDDAGALIASLPQNGTLPARYLVVVTNSSGLLQVVTAADGSLFNATTLSALFPSICASSGVVQPTSRLTVSNPTGVNTASAVVAVTCSNDATAHYLASININLSSNDPIQAAWVIPTDVGSIVGQLAVVHDGRNATIVASTERGVFGFA